MYVLDIAEQEALLGRLVMVEESQDGWSATYFDAASGERWLLYYPESSYHGGGRRILRREPVFGDSIEWALRSVRSMRKDDAVGAGVDLSTEYESWPGILDRLEAEQKLLSPDQIERFMVALGILHPENRRPFIGKQYEEVTSDAEHFRALSERARRLLASIGKSAT